MRKYGPKSNLSPSIGEPCPLCARPFRAGDFTALMSFTRDAERGRYSNRGQEVHWECAQYRPSL